HANHAMSAVPATPSATRSQGRPATTRATPKRMSRNMVRSPVTAPRPVSQPAAKPRRVASWAMSALAGPGGAARLHASATPASSGAPRRERPGSTQREPSAGKKVLGKEESREGRSASLGLLGGLLASALLGALLRGLATLLGGLARGLLRGLGSHWLSTLGSKMLFDGIRTCRKVSNSRVAPAIVRR